MVPIADKSKIHEHSITDAKLPKGILVCTAARTAPEA